MTPTQRTLAWCKSQDWTAGVVEYWQPSFASRGIIEAAKKVVTGAANVNAIRAAVAKEKASGPGKRQDLFGFIDIVAIADTGIVAIQCTSASGLSARVKKIQTECRDPAMAWLGAGGRILAVGWQKYAQPVDRKFWRETVREIKLEDFSS